MSTQQQIITSHLAEIGCSVIGTFTGSGGSTDQTPNIAEIRRKGSVDSSCLNLLQLSQSGTLRRLHSYPSSSDTDTSPPVGPKLTGTSCQNEGIDFETNSQFPAKPPVPERNSELLQLASARRVPPPPPPRTSSRSPLASPTSPQLPPRNLCTVGPPATLLRRIQAPPLIKAFSENNNKLPVDLHCRGPNKITSTSNSSSCESINSQEGLQIKKGRQEQLDQRHQELLRKQKALQEQYARLQQLQRNASGCTTSVSPAPPDSLKKTGSESNLLAKMGLGLSTATISGSLTSLSNDQTISQSIFSLPRDNSSIAPAGKVTTNSEATTLIVSSLSGIEAATSITTTSKVYETDIL